MTTTIHADAKKAGRQEVLGGRLRATRAVMCRQQDSSSLRDVQLVAPEIWDHRREAMDCRRACVMAWAGRSRPWTAADTATMQSVARASLCADKVARMDLREPPPWLIDALRDDIGRHAPRLAPVVYAVLTAALRGRLGIQISWEDAVAIFGCGRRSWARWVAQLEDAGYVLRSRTARGTEGAVGERWLDVTVYRPGPRLAALVAAQRPPDGAPDIVPAQVTPLSTQAGREARRAYRRAYRAARELQRGSMDECLSRPCPAPWRSSPRTGSYARRRLVYRRPQPRRPRGTTFPRNSNILIIPTDTPPKKNKNQAAESPPPRSRRRPSRRKQRVQTTISATPTKWRPPALPPADPDGRPWVVAGVRSRWLAPIWRDVDVEVDGQHAVMIMLAGWDVAPPSEPRFAPRDYYREILARSVLHGDAPAYDARNMQLLGKCGAHVDEPNTDAYSDDKEGAMRPGFERNNRRLTGNARLDGTYRHELRMRLAHVYAKHPDATHVSLSDVNLETLPAAVDEFGWEHVTEVCAWAVAESAEGRIPAQLISTMFRGDGFAAHRNRFLSQRKLAKIHEQEQREREAQCSAPRISAERMIEIMAQDDTFAALAERLANKRGMKRRQPTPVVKRPPGAGVDLYLEGIIEGSQP